MKYGIELVAVSKGIKTYNLTLDNLLLAIQSNTPKNKKILDT